MIVPRADLFPGRKRFVLPPYLLSQAFLPLPPPPHFALSRWCKKEFVGLVKCDGACRSLLRQWPCPKINSFTPTVAVFTILHVCLPLSGAYFIIIDKLGIVVYVHFAHPHLEFLTPDILPSPRIQSFGNGAFLPEKQKQKARMN